MTDEEIIQKITDEIISGLEQTNHEKSICDTIKTTAFELGSYLKQQHIIETLHYFDIFVTSICTAIKPDGGVAKGIGYIFSEIIYKIISLSSLHDDNTDTSGIGNAVHENISEYLNNMHGKYVTKYWGKFTVASDTNTTKH